VRALVVLLALVCAPAIASANVAAFPRTASGVLDEISTARVGASSAQAAEVRQEIELAYGECAVGIVFDPINNRDPTGESVPDPRALIAQAKGAVASAAKQCTAGARGAARATAKFMFGQPTDDLAELGYLHMDQVALWSKCEGPIADGSVPPEVCKRAAAMAKVQIATMVADVAATAAAGYAVGQCRVPVAAPKASLRTPQVRLFDLEVPADLAEAIVGGGGGRPSTLRPGAFAKESIPAHYGRPNAAEQRKVNELMSKHGCHTCGAPTPGTKSGNAVADHQPPQALEEPKEFYPHCIDCQRRQGGEVLQELLRRSR